MPYEVYLTHQDGWLMIEIPALGGMTRTRQGEDVEREARDYIVVTHDVPPPSQVEVVIMSAVIDGVD